MYYNILCYDIDGDPINHFTQWDSGQKIIFKDLNLDEAPLVHFANANSEEALSVQSSLSDGEIIVDVPNILLEESLNIFVYLYEEDELSGTTLYSISIPVREKPKPSNYIYVDNVDYISIKNILKEIEDYQNQILEGTKIEVISNTDNEYKLKFVINNNELTSPNLKGSAGLGIDSWLNSLDLSEHISQSKSLNILSLESGGYICTATGYITNTDANRRGIEVIKGSLIVVDKDRYCVVINCDGQYFISNSDTNIGGDCLVPTFADMEGSLDKKQDAVKVANSTSTNLSIRDKCEYRYQTIETLNLTFPTTFPDIYEATIIFESGDTATTLSYAADRVKFIGDDCDDAGDFIPQANKGYEVSIKNLGYDRVIARVGAF